jgi:hypothetical protein
MDQHSAVGTVGWVASVGLADFHLIMASTAAVMTCIYMSLVIYGKLKK